MARGTRPPPLTISPPPTARTTIIRESRFVEPPMDEYTPPNSIWEDDEEEIEPSTFVKRLRIANDVLHFIACLMLMMIMGTFLNTMQRALSTSAGPAAVSLLIFLSIDIILDLLSAVRMNKSMPGWAVLLRLFSAVAYLTIFMVYVGLGKVFPSKYTYWGLPRGFAGPLVYLFLWLIGVWNLLLTAVYRHRFGRDIRKYAVLLREWRYKRRSPQQRGQSQRRSADVETGRRQPAGGNTITLAHRSVESKGSSIKSASSMQTGEARTPPSRN